MNKAVIARTILSVLPYIDRYCEMLQKVNHARVMESFHGLKDTYTVMDRIIQKTYQVQQLHNLKIKALKEIDALPENQKSVLKLFFLQRKNSQQVALETQVGKRTVFRQINQGVERFSESLDKMGINPLTFRKLVEQNPMLLRREYDKQLTSKG